MGTVRRGFTVYSVVMQCIICA